MRFPLCCYWFLTSSIFYTNRRLQQEKDWVVTNYTLINKLGDIKMAMSEAESNVRGYVINRSPQFVTGFDKARSNITLLHTQVKKLIGKDAAQLVNEDQLRLMTNTSLSELSATLDLFRARPESLKASTIQPANLELSDNINALIRKMIGNEQLLMQKRMLKLNHFYSSTEAMTILSLFMALIAVLYAVITFNSQYKQKRELIKLRIYIGLRWRVM